LLRSLLVPVKVSTTVRQARDTAPPLSFAGWRERDVRADLARRGARVFSAHVLLLSLSQLS
jgi:hypothetical protein